MNLERQNNETDFQYHKRLVYGKLVDKTLSDIDYSELALYLYGKEYSSDVARRMVYGSKRTIDIAEEVAKEGITSNEEIEEIEKKKIELAAERQRFFDQRREFNKLTIKHGRSEHLFDVLTKSASELDEKIGKLFDEPERKTNLNISGNQAVLVLSDWHYGLVADNIFNIYDTEICKSRVIDLVNSVNVKLALHKVEKLHVVILGDLIHGAIHTSARVASEELVCDQIMNVSEILAQAIAELAKNVGEVHVHSTYGNHARTVQNKADNIHADNMEKIIPWWLQQRLAGSNVTIHTDYNYELLLFNVFGYTFCGAHGDLDTVKSAPKTLYSLISKQYGVSIDYILLGDKHHRESFEEIGITAMMCGSLCGADEYANNNRLFSDPSQLLLIVEEDEGVTAEYRIKNFTF